ncbi:hypothetical protein SPHINGOT1_460016 [Sphingomonas sp. T1]|nr:hypothetical protein SPHINGOT1_460016 [Sphingomonas sp. T1]
MFFESQTLSATPRKKLARIHFSSRQRCKSDDLYRAMKKTERINPRSQSMVMMAVQVPIADSLLSTKPGHLQPTRIGFLHQAMPRFSRLRA